MISVSDTTGTISAQAKADLEATTTPFRVKAIFESTTKGELQAHVRSCVDSPTTMCIGVDPIHRFTWTEIGIDTGIRSADYQQVARAGNGEFKQGNWAGGVQAIASRGAALVQRSASGTPVVIQQPRTVVEHPVSPWPFVIGFGVLLLAGWAMWRIIRRLNRKTEEAIQGLQEERFEYASRNVEAMTTAVAPRPAADPPRPVLASAPVAAPQRRYAAPVHPAVVVVQERRDDRFTDGLLMGSMMSRPAVVERVYERPVEPVRRREPTPEPVSSYSSDSGGGSSWGSDNSSGGGSGGGFDGGDSGGGGGGDF